MTFPNTLETHTPATVSQLFKRLAQGTLADLSHCATLSIAVSGTLGTFHDGPQAFLFDVPLKDGACEIPLKVRRDLLRAKGVQPGDSVLVVGAIEAALNQYTEHRLALRIDVAEITRGNDRVAAPEDESVIACLRSLSAIHRTLPRCERLRISVICSQSGQVSPDFENQLADLRPVPEVTYLPVSMTDPWSIAAQIRDAKGDVVAVIRGGGKEAQFAAFEHPLVLNAFAECRAYRVTGLGHSRDRTLLDLIADFAADTPTAAGVHIAAAVRGQKRSDAGASYARGRLRDAQQQLDRAQNANTQLIASLKALRVRLLAGIAASAFVAGFLSALWLLTRRG